MSDGRIELDKNFNCTIQELKHDLSASVRELAARFQLHHTGIKTRAEQAKRAASRSISIAPYRN